MLTLLLLTASLQLPSTDIYVAELRVQNGRVMVGPPANVTSRPGYDNQPFFLPDGRSFFYTSVREDSQADIYRYDLAGGTVARVTATPESEYSPAPVPHGGFAVVRVEADSTQRLWVFDSTGGNPRVLLESVQPVGYFARGDRALALFVLGSPPTLQLFDFETTEVSTMAWDIGRSLLRVPGRDAISFVQKDSVGWTIAEIDPRTRAIRPLVKALDQVDFFTWTPDGIVLIAQGTKLYQWNPARAPGWEEVADFTAAGFGTMSRLAVSPTGDRLAIVAAPGP